ncbi:hypothetical protein AAGT10_14930 (plasmid) [Sulfolobus tengchongensis]
MEEISKTNLDKFVEYVRLYIKLDDMIADAKNIADEQIILALLDARDAIRKSILKMIES